MRTLFLIFLLIRPVHLTITPFTQLGVTQMVRYLCLLTVVGMPGLLLMRRVVAPSRQGMNGLLLLTEIAADTTFGQMVREQISVFTLILATQVDR